MAPELFGIEHILYIVITAILGGVGLFFAYRYAKSDKTQSIILKSLALALFLSVVINRISQVFRYDTIRWYCIIPDSICSMTSFVLSLAVLFGKKDNDVYHCTWLLGLFGGISTVIYATFINQDLSFFYIPTITGLLHHSFAAIVVVALFLFKQINITYKKWYCTLICLAGYISVGAFLMNVFDLSDAFHLAEPLLPNTPLTIWVMTPMYVAAYGAILLVVELVRRKNKVAFVKKY